MKKRFMSIRKPKEELDVDITSLLDVLTILLFFLLKSYNATDLSVDLVEHLTLPVSNSEILGNDSVTVQVNSDQKIWVNNQLVGEIDKKSKDQIIDPLMTKLSEIKTFNDDAIEKMKTSGDEKIIAKKKDTHKTINLVLDQSLPYEILRKVMHTSASAGFPEFKFIIQSHHE